MALISFAQSMFGIVFVIRTSSVFRARGLIREAHVTKTGTTCISALCLVGFFCAGHAGAAFFCTLAATFGPLILFIAIERARLREFHSRVPIFLDRWILGLRLGHSVSAARDAALREECEDFQALMRPLFETRAYERAQHPLLSANMLKELEQIAHATHAATARLQNLRQLIRKTSEFRRKSGQATRQTAIQSAVMMVLLLALALFTVRRYGWTATGDLVVAALGLSLTGIALMVRLARKTKWKF
jgi:Flp pilus assembly protein TadB